jgi:two-component system, OmpR family, KDP operon response regulator KdpE
MPVSSTPATLLPATIRPRTILIVEDDEVLGQVLARVLTFDGRIALHVRTVAEALQQMQAGRPQLVLVDAGLRDGRGLKLAETIRSTEARVPVILLTTHRLEKSDLPSRGERLVTKSIDLPELRRTIDAALRESAFESAAIERGAEASVAANTRRPSMSQ